jgi:uncharacterized protein
MKKTLVDNILCCPVDRAFPLTIEEAAYEGGELQSGVLRCPECGNGYPVIAGIPNMLPPSEYQAAEVESAKMRESKARDADADIYDSNVPEYQTQVDISNMLNALKITRGQAVMDLGAGTGRLTIELARLTPNVLALDISPHSLEKNRSKCMAAGLPLPEFIAADACYLPLRGGLLHKAASVMMIEHIPTAEERRRCLDEVHRVLKPGGRLVMTAYNYSWSKRKHNIREGFHGNDLYYYNFDRSEFRTMLSSFQIRKLTALLNLPAGMKFRPLDDVIAAIPPLAALTGEMLFAVAERKAGGA